MSESDFNEVTRGRLSEMVDRDGARLYLRPLGLVTGPTAEMCLASGLGRPLAGDRVVYTQLELNVRAQGEVARSLVDPATVRRLIDGLPPEPRQYASATLDRLSASRPAIAGVTFDRPRIIAVVNVTPDSFSDGGADLDPEDAQAHARRCRTEGADLIDIGAESARPFADPVAAEEELSRLKPALQAILAEPGTIVSVDTRHAATMRAAIEAGAQLINDVSALRADAESLGVVAAGDMPVVLMHMQGDPQTMQIDPRYDDALLDIYDFLEDRIAACEAVGIGRERIIVDPGICFGKTEEHNMELLRGLSLFHGLGCPVLVGVSRKGLTGAHHERYEPRDRLPGSLVAAAVAWDQGVQMVRVHDVAETVQARMIWEALHPVL